MGFIQNLTSLIRETLNLNGHIDTASAERSIRSNIEFKGPNAWILAVAVIIASVGLNVNSIPVVIGAMLISPLMGPIFGLGLGLGVSESGRQSCSFNRIILMSTHLLLQSIEVHTERAFCMTTRLTTRRIQH